MTVLSCPEPEEDANEDFRVRGKLLKCTQLDAAPGAYADAIQQACGCNPARVLAANLVLRAASIAVTFDYCPKPAGMAAFALDVP